MKRVSITALAVAAVGFSAGAVTAEPIPTTITSPKSGEVFYQDTVNVSATVDPAAPLGHEGIVWAVRDRSVGKADDGCRGSDVLFGNLAEPPDDADLMEGEFSAEIDVTGLEPGKYCLAINNRDLGAVGEEIRRDVVDFYVVGDYAKISGGFRWAPDGVYRAPGNSPTHAFDGVIGSAGEKGLVGAIEVNYREERVTCTFTPGYLSTLVFLEPDGNDHPVGVRAVVSNLVGTCDNDAETTTARVFILEKDSVLGNRDDGDMDRLLDAPRGAVVLRFSGDPDANPLSIDATPGSTGVASWILLERGNAEVGVR